MLWSLVFALVSIVASLICGRLLARARQEQTGNPFAVRGPSTESMLPARRETLLRAAELRVRPQVHLN